MPPFTLYHGTLSICGAMLRMLFACRAPGEPGWTEHLLMLQHNDQIQEYFLKINPDGHVPVLKDGDRFIIETIVITRHLEAFLPSLYPQEHMDFIYGVLEELLQINFWGLTHALRADGKPPDRAPGNMVRDGCMELLKRDDISDEYRSLLQHKLDHHRKVKLDAEEDGVALVQHGKVTALFTKVTTALAATDGPWLFGDHLSVLDCHLTPLMARLRAIHKEALINDHAGLSAYADRLLALKEWKEVKAAGPGAF